MPLYEYKCENVECRRTTEVLIKSIKRAPKQRRCPICNGSARKVQHSSSNFALKGGWPGKGGY
jgi:putative FmdB family regulatory protein